MCAHTYDSLDLIRRIDKTRIVGEYLRNIQKYIVNVNVSGTYMVYGVKLTP